MIVAPFTVDGAHLRSPSTVGRGTIQADAAIGARRVQVEGRVNSGPQVIRYGLLKPNVLEAHVSKAAHAAQQEKAASLNGTRYRDTIKFAS
jgi:hypothetical protein